MNKNRIFWGIIFVLAAIFLIVGKLGQFEDFSVFSLMFTVFLIAFIIKSIYPPNFAGILFPLAFLCIIYNKPLGIQSLTPWTVLAVATLGSIGLSMLFQNKKSPYYSGFQTSDYDFEIIDEEDDSHVKQKTDFGASTKYINSENFKQADLECSFGAMKVYFENAHIIGNQAVVRIHARFSGMELYIPKEWYVDNRIKTTLGGIDEKNRNQPNGLINLVLIGEMSFSGIEIIYI